MDKKTKLTLNELVKRKAQIQEARRTRKTQDLYIEALDGVITITDITRDMLADITKMDAGPEQVNKYLLYNCVTEPDLKDKNLQAEFECAEPYDIVDKLFSGGEIGQISDLIGRLSGLSSGVEVVEDIKNS